jgi:hypothetical protein
MSARLEAAIPEWRERRFRMGNTKKKNAARENGMTLATAVLSVSTTLFMTLNVHRTDNFASKP